MAASMAKYEKGEDYFHKNEFAKAIDMFRQYTDQEDHHRSNNRKYLAWAYRHVHISLLLLMCR